MSDDRASSRWLKELPAEERDRLVRRLVARRRERAPGDGEARPVRARPRPDEAHDPFPLTPLQEAYWVGRDTPFEAGRHATHSYMELETDLPPEALERAWRAMVDRHGMLRAVFTSDGRQRILDRCPPYEIRTFDLRNAGEGEREETIEELREGMSHRIHDASEWPLFEVRAAHLPGGRTRIFLSLDALVADAWSQRILLREWGMRARDPEADLPDLELTFRDYVLALEEVRGSPEYQAHRRYWLERVDALPEAPRLPLRRAGARPRAFRFVRRSREIGGEDWARIKERGRSSGLTPSVLLFAAYADVLALWAENERFSLSVPSFNRRSLHPHVNRVVGEFASFTIVEADPRSGGSFQERAQRYQSRLLEGLSHDLFEGVEVLREWARRRPEGTEGSVLPVIFTAAPGDETVGAAASGAERKGAPLGEIVHGINQSSQVWMDLHVADEGGVLRCDFDTVDGLFPPGLPEGVLASFFLHLERLAASDAWWERPWREAAPELLPPEQRERRIRVNATEGPVPDRLIHDRIREQAERSPDRAAVVTPNRTLTFGELDRLAGGWARHLRSRGAGGDGPVGVLLEKGWRQPVAVLAALEAGAPYLPLDPYDPPARLRSLVEGAGVRHLLTRAELASALDLSHVQVHAIGGEAPEEGRGKPPGRLQTPDDVAVLIYTSGSTGEPKAVKLTHRGIENALGATRERFRVGESDGVLALTALHHDMSLFDLFGVLGSGGRMILPSPQRRRDPEHWLQRIRSEGATLWNSVPAMMEMAVELAEAREEPGLERLRLAFLGGDWIPVTLPDRIRERAPGIELVSVGGPTETTLWNIWYPIVDVDPEWPSIPYGRPIRNTKYHVLDRDRVDRPDWVAGEMWVEGVGVTPGYLGDDAKTRERTATHPRTGVRIFRTGDRGRYRDDGALEFVGRVDHQLQLRGQRVEPAEIESALMARDDVRRAVVTGVGERGAERLVAYLVPDDPAEAPDDGALVSYLSRRLPDHMVPRSFVRLERLPLNRNGKVDRAALREMAPAPGGAQEEDPTSDAAPRGAAPGPEGPILDTVLSAVREILGVDDASPEAGLLDLGANSIDLVRIGNLLEERLGRRPGMDDLFRLRSVRELAAFYEEEEGEAVPDAWEAWEPRDPGREYEVYVDPEEKEAFRASEPGIRRDLDDRSRTALPAPDETPAERRARFLRRRSHRTYSLRPLSLEAFGRLLDALSREEVEGGPKYLYASPGGLYPTQTYLHVWPGRVEGVAGGTYYYDPTGHELVVLEEGASISKEIHVPFVNQPIFAEAAFSVFLVTQMDAIGPAYGSYSLRFATLEAGVMAHQLEAAAAGTEVGLCQIGSVEFGRIRHLFHLDDSHVLVHSLVGGRVAESGADEAPRTGGGRAERIQRLAQKVDELSDEEVEALLRAERGERDAE